VQKTRILPILFSVPMFGTIVTYTGAGISLFSLFAGGYPNCSFADSKIMMMFLIVQFSAMLTS